MTDREKYKKTFSALEPERDYLEKITNTEVIKMKDCKDLDEVRENIDRIDDQIIRLIAERGGYVKQAAAFKKNEESVRDSSRVEAVILKARTKAELYDADPDLIEKLYRSMINSFINMEMKEFKGVN